VVDVAATAIEMGAQPTQPGRLIRVIKPEIVFAPRFGLGYCAGRACLRCSMARAGPPLTVVSSASPGTPGRYVRCDRESSGVPVEGPDSGRTRRFARGPSQESRLQFVQRIGDAYGLVLVLILTTFVVTMTLPPQGWGGRVVAVSTAGLTAVIALTSSDVPLRRVRFAAGAALAAVIATALAKPVSSDVLLGVAFVVDSLLLAVAAVTILRRVVPSAMVDFRTILGAISVFTLLGLLFGFLFLALGRLQGGDVFTGVFDAQARDYLFFSYTTLTTTGYGNLVPAGDIGQILAVFEMLTGQIFLVTLVAGLVSLWRPGARAADRAGGRDEQPA
jgi:hypothetical protein